MRLSSDILRPFTGEGDVVMWLDKLKLVVKLQKIEDVVTLILMYLKGNALVVYLEIGEKDQAESIVKRLKTAFSKGAFETYNKLRKVTWTGKPVNVYAAEIRWLAGLVGYTFNSKNVPESLLPQIVVTVNGKRAKAFIDTSYTTMLVMTGVADSWSGASNIRVVDDRGEVLWWDWHQNCGKEYTAMTQSNCAR